MRKFARVLALFLLGLIASAWAKKDEPLDELIARANAAPADKQPDLFAEIAEREMDSVAGASKANRTEEVQTDLQQVVTYCDRAEAAAIHSKKHVKRTEIRIRQLSHRLRDMKEDVDPDNVLAVQAAIDKLEHFRAELLRSLFDLKDDDRD